MQTLNMAGSVKLFSFNQKLSHVIGIFPPESNRNDEPSSLNSRNWIVIISFALLAIPSVAFFVFEAKSMLDYGISFFSASITLFMLCVYLIMIWQKKNSWQFIENCERFIERREHAISAYRKMIRKIERFCEFVGIASMVTTIFATLQFLLYSLVNYYIFDRGEESFVLAFPVKWPFDLNTPLGYFVAWIGQTAGIVAMSLTSILFLNLTLVSCWLFIFMVEDITKDLFAFNIDVKKNDERPEWMKHFCAIVQLYSDAKQCVHEFNAIVKYSLFTFIFLLMLSVSSSLLTLQFQLLDKNGKLLDTSMVFIMVLWIFGILFFVCELGERMTYHFDMFHGALEQCDWHMLPVEWQRMYLLFLSDTQQPKNITCYGNILSTRETLKKITKTGFSYFITLRRFET